MKIDKAAIEAAQDMGRTPNTGAWDLPKNLDNTLCVGREFLKLVDAYKLEQKTVKALRAELRDVKRRLRKTR